MCVDGLLCCCGSAKNQTIEENSNTENGDSHEMAAPVADGDESAENHHRHADDGPGETDPSDSSRPGHLGPVKQLHSATGHNLAVAPDGEVYGTREQYSEDAVLEITATAPTEVQIKGKAAETYIAMNERGKIYAEEDSNSENTIWIERFDGRWNSYVWKRNPETDWFLGIKKSGKPKRGDKTRAGQKAVRFLPRPAYPQNY